MVQGNFKSNNKKSVKKPQAKSTSKQVGKYTKAVKLTRLGNPLQLPKNAFREQALEDRVLTKAIGVANEQKVAAKLIQNGGKVTTADIKAKGKELARDLNRQRVTKKVGRVEQKLNALKKQDEGL